MIYILFNKLANNGKCEKTADGLVAKFGENESQKISYIGLKMTDFFSKLTESDKIILCGGDGTLNRFANDTDGLQIPCEVFLCKAGSGNDFLRDVGNKATDDMVQINEYIDNLPTVTVNGNSYRFINGVGYGIDGMVCQKADDMKAQGITDINYSSISIKLCLGGYKCPNAKITVDGVTKSYRKVWLAPAMNGRFYGGGMDVAPDQDRKSGKLTCVVWYGTGKLTTLMRFPGIFKGEHIKHKKMCDVLVGDEISVEFSLPTAMQIDGEVIRGVTKYTAQSSATVQQKEPVKA